MTQQDISRNNVTISTFEDFGVPIVSETEIDPMKRPFPSCSGATTTALNRAAARTESRRAGRRVLARLSRIGLVLHAVVGRCGRPRQPGQRHLPVGMDFERELLLAKRATQLTRIASMDPRSVYRDLVTHRFK